MFQGHEVPHTGFHSIIRRVENPTQEIEGAEPGAAYLIKEYGPKAHGFHPEHAEAIIGHMKAFTHAAKGIGIPVAEPHSYHIQPNAHAGRVNIVEIVKEVGPDLRTLISDPSQTTPEQALGLIDSYLTMHQRVWEADFPISLDPPLANFCLKRQNGNGREEVVYIDMMPPRRRISKSKVISEWPTPPDESRSFIEARYFSPQQAQVIYLQILRAATPRGISPEQIKRHIGKRLGEEAVRAIDYNPARKAHLLANPRTEDADALRIIAAEELFNGQINMTQFTTIYELTHIGNGGILPSVDRLYEACDILKTGIKGIYQRRSVVNE